MAPSDSASPRLWTVVSRSWSVARVRSCAWVMVVFPVRCLVPGSRDAGAGCVLRGEDPGVHRSQDGRGRPREGDGALPKVRDGGGGGRSGWRAAAGGAGWGGLGRV